MKKVLIGLSAVALAVASVPLFAAFEAHVINVTAHIENALRVHPEAIEFGTVFPQEYVEKQFTISMSDSFSSETRVDDVEYVIKQKPKPTAALIAYFDGDVDQARAYCHDEGAGAVVPGSDPAVVGCYLSLCPFLSKIDGDPEDHNDTSHPSYYNDPTPDKPNSGDEYCEAVSGDASGRLSKIEGDRSDTWIVDLKVPPVRGYIGQDWPRSCYPYVVAQDSQDYGCDLWIEVTRISDAPKG